jgi:hypothetical protein
MVAILLRFDQEEIGGLKLVYLVYLVDLVCPVDTKQTR